VSTRSVSIVVNTYNRADSLALTLSSFEQLDHPSFEVVVVNGPSTDATEEVLARWAGRIKVGRCPNRNLSESRNIGIRLAAGEIVAFIDDDAYPDPGWLGPIVAAYDDSEVAAAGGPVYNFTGYDIQAWRNYVDRLGNASVEFGPAPDLTGLLSSPGGNVVPYTIGTNSSFRRALLVGLGGFDEEFEYYLDESDVCRRIVDAGYLVQPLDHGFVYHKFLPSDVRDRPEIPKSHFQVLKSKCYFALKHGTGFKSFAEISRDFADFVDARAAEVDTAVARGWLDGRDRLQFAADVDEASDLAHAAFRRPTPRTRPAGWFDQLGRPFLPFETLRPASDKLHLAFLSQEYPPGRLNGIGRFVHLQARGLAAAGHIVHVLTRSDGYPRVDLEERVWVHRLPVGSFPAPASPVVPQHLWDHAATMTRELARIDEQRPLDVVQGPNWDSEAVAAELDGRYRVAVSLVTPIKTLTRVDPVFAARLHEEDPTIRDMVALDRWVYEHADGVLADSHAVVEEIESEYGIELDRATMAVVPLGLPDVSEGVRPAARPGRVHVLFVGRLEARKGIDVLLSCVPELAERHEDVVFTVVGDQPAVVEGSVTFRRAFEAYAGTSRGRVQFAGAIDDAMLWRFYAGADIIVVPSRFESFGLVVIEGMLFSKPVVASAVGGMNETVIDGETGLLVAPGDVGELTAALSRLIESEQLRITMGAAGRRRYEAEYSLEAMTRRGEAFYRRLLGRPARGSGTTPRSGSPSLVG
jgi:glycosyltransferase involved in cell wall biosynthesis